MQFAIVSDVTPTRCNIDLLVEADDALDVARDHNVSVQRIMLVDRRALDEADEIGRCWHADGVITALS